MLADFVEAANAAKTAEELDAAYAAVAAPLANHYDVLQQVTDIHGIRRTELAEIPM